MKRLAFTLGGGPATPLGGDDMPISKLRILLLAATAPVFLASCSTADRDHLSNGPVLRQGSSQSAPATSQNDIHVSPNPWPGQNVRAPTPLTGTTPPNASGSLANGGASGTSGPAGRVDVNLDRVRLNVARKLNIDASKVPATMELPVTVAASLCGVDVNALAAQRRPGGGKPTCVANDPEMATDVVEPSIE
jgi:hypothetical protein